LAFAALLWPAGEEPHELYYGKPKQGTSQFHAYASAASLAAEALYLGADLGAASRIDGDRAAAIDGNNPRNWLENQISSAGSSVLQRPVVEFLQLQQLRF